MFDNQVTRNQFGSNNTRETETFSDQPIEDWTKFHEYFEDFDYYTGPVAPGTTNGYTLTGTGSTVTYASADGGAINLIAATTAFIAAWQRTAANFNMVLGLRTFFEVISQISTLASNAQLILGLTNLTTTPFTGGQLTAGVWLSSAAGTGALSINIAQGGVVTTVALGVNLVAAASFMFKFYWDGGVYAAAPNGRIVWEVSGAGVSANARGEVAAPASFPAATLLAPMLAVSGTAGTPTLTVDLVYALKERVNVNATPVF